MRPTYLNGIGLLAVTMTASLSLPLSLLAQPAPATQRPTPAQVDAAVLEAAEIATDKAIELNVDKPVQNDVKAQDAKKDKDAKKAKEGDDAAAVTFEFQPSSVSMNSSLNFDQNGKVNNSNASLSIGMRVKYESEAQPVQVRNIQITHTVTDAKESLTSQSRGSEQSLFSWENNNGQRTQRSEFHLHMSFVAPNRPARKLTEISGTMDVIYASGEPAEAVLKPFSDFEGKRITFKDMPGQFIMFTRDDQNRGGNNQKQIRVEMPKDLRPHIAKITFFDEAGRELRFNGWGGGTNNNTEYRTLNVPLPDKGQIRVQMYPRVDTKQVPFKIQDVPLVPEAQGEVNEVMVELKPIGPVDGEITLERLEPVVEQ